MLVNMLDCTVVSQSSVRTWDVQDTGCSFASIMMAMAGICVWLSTGAVGGTITDRCWRNADGLQRLRWRLRLVGIRPETWTGTYWMRRRRAIQGNISASSCPLGVPSDTCLVPRGTCRKLEFSSPCVRQLPTSSRSSVPFFCILSLLSFFYSESSLFLTSAAVYVSNCQCSVIIGWSPVWISSWYCHRVWGCHGCLQGLHISARITLCASLRPVSVQPLLGQL
jgi:hypothetical protein